MGENEGVWNSIPKPDSDMVSHIQVVVIAPRTNRKLVTRTCLNLKEVKENQEKIWKYHV